MRTLRFPVAAVSGTLLSAGVFLGLAHLIGRPIDVPPPVVAEKIDFRPTRVETPLTTKRDPKVEREALPPEFHVGPIGPPGEKPVVTKAVYRQSPTVDLGRGGTGLPVGADRDVIPLVRVAPDYPPRAQSGDIEGWVQVQFTITASGSVRDPVVVASEPGTIFDDAALKAIARWRYNPRVDGGIPVERVGMQTLIRFELN